MVDPESLLVIGEICHIRGERPKSARHDPKQTAAERHDYENLIVLCPTHHTIVDGDEKKYPVAALLQMKKIWEEQARNMAIRVPLPLMDAFWEKYRSVNITGNTGNIAVNSPGAMQAQTLNVRQSKGTIKFSPPPGTIGFDQKAAAYVAHLIERYNEFAHKHPSRGAVFSYGAISRNITAKFGSKWQLLPLERAPDVFSYLQKRIGKTFQGKINSGKGHRSFSSYEEFFEKHKTK
ncbi:hypothetical protein [Ferrovibrio sp.]|uniref:hypothetical protein n=1 Tax=Ferrovibrio sp. TaxID=1917215 RepID=UPI00311E07B2